MMCLNPEWQPPMLEPIPILPVRLINHTNVSSNKDTQITLEYRRQPSATMPRPVALPSASWYEAPASSPPGQPLCSFRICALHRHRRLLMTLLPSRSTGHDARTLYTASSPAAAPAPHNHNIASTPSPSPSPHPPAIEVSVLEAIQCHSSIDGNLDRLHTQPSAGGSAESLVSAPAGSKNHSHGHDYHHQHQHRQQQTPNQGQQPRISLASRPSLTSVSVSIFTLHLLPSPGKRTSTTPTLLQLLPLRRLRKPIPRSITTKRESEEKRHKKETSIHYNFNTRIDYVTLPAIPGPISIVPRSLAKRRPVPSYPLLLLQSNLKCSFLAARCPTASATAAASSTAHAARL